MPHQSQRILPAAIERVAAISATKRWVPASIDLATAVEQSRLDQTYNTPALSTIFLLAEQAELTAILAPMRADIVTRTAKAAAQKAYTSWPAYRVSQGETRSFQWRLNDCFRQQRFPYPGYASDVTIALGVFMGVNAKGAESIAPALKR